VIDTTELLDLAVDIGGHAGALLMERRPPGDLEYATKSSPTDVVTVMDTAAERLIATALRAARPDDGILGEEGADASGATGVRWIVDPIDGTVNYLYGIPQWAVSIAAELHGEIVVGVVHNPVIGETFTARRGAGAHLAGRRLAVTPADDLSKALVATGFSYVSAHRARQAKVLRAVLPAVRDIRRAGSAALDLCWVAAGRLDGFYEQELKPWDLAAGSLVAREAGARVEGPGGRPPGAGLTVAAGPALFPALHDLVASAVGGGSSAGTEERPRG
jgi:myo-inositol-1(or 4)-monophosphatase